MTGEGSLPEIVQCGPSSRFECFTASKGSNNYFYSCKPQHFPNLFLFEIELLYRFVQLLCNGKQPHRQCLVHPFNIDKMRLSLSDLVYLSLSSTKELFHWHRSSNQNKMVPIWLEPVGLLVTRFVFDTTNIQHAA